MVIFLDFKDFVDSNDRTVLSSDPHQKGMPVKIGSLRMLYSRFSTRAASLSLINFAIDNVMEDALRGLKNVDIELANGEKPCDLVYAYDLVC